MCSSRLNETQILSAVGGAGGDCGYDTWLGLAMPETRVRGLLAANLMFPIHAKQSLQNTWETVNGRPKELEKYLPVVKIAKSTSEFIEQYFNSLYIWH